MSSDIPVFKPWVPEWIIRIALLLVVLPGVILFALSISNVNAAAGYYGVTPNDAQFSLVIFYGSMASFLVLEGRFFKNIASKSYLLIGIILLITACYICYVTRSFVILLIVRFVQGMLTCGTIGITLTLMFSRLHGERAREIGYSVVYCVLLCVVPLTTLITAAMIDAFDFNVIYKAAMFSYLPGGAVMAVIMNNVRLNRKFPLYQLDWPSYFVYSGALCSLGYVLVYGQEYDWLGDRRIHVTLAAVIALFMIFVTRQFVLKRPYVHLQVFKNPKFVLGTLLLFVFYICRGSFGITTAYMGTVLGMDPIHIGYLLLYNIAGIIVAVIVTSRLVLAKKPLRLIFIYGFLLLLFFHVRMCFIFSTQVDATELIIPLIVQGLGAGMLMVPIILFLVSSSPAKFGATGSAVGIFVRFLGFCSSIALINYFNLSGQNAHYIRLQQELSVANPALIQRLEFYKQGLASRGMLNDQATKVANGLLSKSMLAQAQLRFAMDYYQLISGLLVFVILLIALFPSVNNTIVRLRSKQPAPIAY